MLTFVNFVRGYGYPRKISKCFWRLNILPQAKILGWNRYRNLVWEIASFYSRIFKFCTFLTFSEDVEKFSGEASTNQAENYDISFDLKSEFREEASEIYLV